MSDPRGQMPTQKELQGRERQQQQNKERNRLPDDATVDVEQQRRQS